MVNLFIRKSFKLLDDSLLTAFYFYEQLCITKQKELNDDEICTIFKKIIAFSGKTFNPDSTLINLTCFNLIKNNLEKTIKILFINTNNKTYEMFQIIWYIAIKTADEKLIETLFSSKQTTPFDQLNQNILRIEITESTGKIFSTRISCPHLSPKSYW